MIEYKILYEISRLLNTETDLRNLLELAVDKVIESTNAQTGLLLVCGKNGDLLFECARHCDKIDIEKPDSEISKTIIKKVLESGESLVLENALEDPAFDASASVKALELGSIACAPLKTDGETYGVIYIDNRDLTALFNENTKTLLDELSKLISVQVKNSLEHRKLIEQQRKLEARLQEEQGYGRIIGSSPAMTKVFELVEQIASTDAIVLITGETGTGK
ncbi:GAF domain-containing protein, partial [bacterium]|nr:GAF domain-containing protein [bacterium]